MSNVKIVSSQPLPITGEINAMNIKALAADLIRAFDLIANMETRINSLQGRIVDLETIEYRLTTR